ncbi:MAG TPA: hypothetical protein VEI28_03330, partial [Thermodesulfovibrionales bacterium]|nr:hypothetical protein [Thermodesulfovibrionales bacterium]
CWCSPEVVRIVGGIILMGTDFQFFLPTYSAKVLADTARHSDGKRKDVAFVPLAIRGYRNSPRRFP